jgi:hypothetical protein
MVPGLHGKKIIAWPNPAQSRLSFTWAEENLENAGIDIFNPFGGTIR